MCSKLKINTARPSSGVFFADFDQSAYQYSVSTFNFQQLFASRVWKTSNKVMKTQKAIYLFRNKSWKTYFIQWFIIALNWIWTYVWTLNLLQESQAYYHRFVPFLDLLYHRYFQEI